MKISSVEGCAVAMICTRILSSSATRTLASFTLVEAYKSPSRYALSSPRSVVTPDEIKDADKKSSCEMLVTNK